MKKLLGEPDRREHQQGRGPALSLYELDRVLSVEGSQKFKDAVAAATQRTHATKKSAASKRKILLSIAATWPIDIKVIPISDIYKQVLQGDDPAGFKPRIIKSWAAHFVLTNLTNVDGLCARLHSKVGGHEAAEAIERRARVEIAQVYPELAAACRRGPSPRVKLLSFEEIQQVCRRIAAD